MEEKLSDDIKKLQEMFPRISERSIRFVFQKNRSDFDKTLDSLLDFPSGESNGSQPDNSGKVNSLGYRITEEIETFTIEDSGEEGNSSEINDNFTLNQTFDKLEYLSGIFPDVQKEYFKKHLDEINNDDAKFHIFLTDSLGDPNKLPRQTSETRLCSNKRDRDGNCDSNEVNEPSLTRSSKKPRTGKGKSVSKMSEFGPGPAENVECSICQSEFDMSMAVKCNSGCLFCMPCAVRKFLDRTSAKQVNNVDCFLSCGENFSRGVLQISLPPALFFKLDIFHQTDKEENRDEKDKSVLILEESNVIAAADKDSINWIDEEVEVINETNPNESLQQGKLCENSEQSNQNDAFIKEKVSELRNNLKRFSMLSKTEPRDASMSGFCIKRSQGSSSSKMKSKETYQYPFRDRNRNKVMSSENRIPMPYDWESHITNRSWRNSIFSSKDSRRKIGNPGGREGKERDYGLPSRLYSRSAYNYDKNDVFRIRCPDLCVIEKERKIRMPGDSVYDRDKASGSDSSDSSADNDDNFPRGQKTWKEENKKWNQKKEKNNIVELLKSIASIASRVAAFNSANIMDEVFLMIEKSALIPYIENKLQSCTCNFVEIENNSSLYRLICVQLSVQVKCLSLSLAC